MRVRTGASGVYVLAAAVFQQEQLESVRDVLRSLPRRNIRFHWTDASPQDRLRATELVAGIPALHRVVVHRSMEERKQERARALCLECLLWNLECDGVLDVAMEGRTQTLNRADVRTLMALRSKRVLHPQALRLRHGRPNDEPLLWAGDIIAGAFREGHDGRTEYRLGLADVAVEYMIG